MKAICNSNLKLELLYNELVTNFGMDIEEFPEEIESRYGQRISIREGNLWASEVRLLIPSYSSYSVRLPQILHSNPVIDYIARWFVIEELSTKTIPRSVECLVDSLSRLQFDADISSNKFFNALTGWISSEINSAYVAQKIEFASAIVTFIDFAIENETYGFDTTLRNTAAKARFGTLRPGGKLKSLSDPLVGPFSQLELQLISVYAFESNILTWEEKAYLLLCRDFGLRPIQIALLRECDLNLESTTPYIVIPGAKGIRKSKLRRHPNNTFQRFLSKEAVMVFKNLISSNMPKHLQIDCWYRDFCRKHSRKYKSLTKPLFPRSGNWDQMEGYLTHPKLSSYAPHKTSGNIACRISALTERLSIPSERSPLGILNISSYRFRRTIATSMVLQGYSPEEIAEALDHESLSSIEHYFRWSSDVVQYINSTFNRNEDIKNLVEFWDKGVTPQSGDFTHVRLSAIASLGLCMNQSPCEYHPTVSCYGCPKFKPYIDGAHQEALENIDAMRIELRSNSSGAVKTQLENAFIIAKKIVEAQNEIYRS